MSVFADSRPNARKLADAATRTSLLSLNPGDVWSAFLILLPAWWVLGIEQFVWAVPAAWSLLYLARHACMPSLHPVLLWMAGLIAAILVSASAIDEDVRWLTFTRLLGAYVVVLVLGFVLLSDVVGTLRVQRLLGIWMLALGLGSLIGILGILGIGRGQFTSLLGTIMPGWIAETGYGSVVATRSIGSEGWVLGVNYFRVTSLFLWPAMFALALVSAIPICAYKIRNAATQSRRVLYGAIAVVLSLNLLFTSGRMAMLGLVVGGTYFVLAVASHRLRKSLVLGAAAVLGLSVIVAVSVTGFEGAMEQAQRVVREAAYARGSGSVESRAAAYGETIRGVAERPVHGWGTERDVGLGIPAGSHGYYLGVAFRHGLVGFGALVGVMIVWWKKTALSRRSTMRDFAPFARWSLIAVAVNALTSSIDLDTTAFVGIALVFWSAIRLAPVRCGSSCRSPSRENVIDGEC